MRAHLGTVGTMAPISCIGLSVGVKGERPTSFKTTLGGRRVAFTGPRTHREWDVSVDTALPREVAQVRAFVEGEFGPGPWWWLDPWAQSTNILPPRVASMEVAWQGTVHGGPVALPDGSVAGRSLIAAGGSVHVDASPDSRLYLPVVPGVPVTASAWLSSADQQIRLAVRDSASQVLATTPGSTTGVDRLARVSTTMVPPTGAHHALVSIIGAGRIVRPAVTWTPDVTDYGAGAGCEHAVLADVSTSPVRLNSTHGSVFASYDFTVTEVGP